MVNQQCGKHYAGNIRTSSLFVSESTFNVIEDIHIYELLTFTRPSLTVYQLESISFICFCISQCSPYSINVVEAARLKLIFVKLGRLTSQCLFYDHLSGIQQSQIFAD